MDGASSAADVGGRPGGRGQAGGQLQAPGSGEVGGAMGQPAAVVAGRPVQAGCEQAGSVKGLAQDD